MFCGSTTVWLKEAGPLEEAEITRSFKSLVLKGFSSKTHEFRSTQEDIKRFLLWGASPNMRAAFSSAVSIFPPVHLQGKVTRCTLRLSFGPIEQYPKKPKITCGGSGG